MLLFCRVKEDKQLEKSGTGTDAVYITTLKFFGCFQFLKGNFVPRPTKSNMDMEAECIVTLTLSTYAFQNPPSLKSF